MFQPLFHISWTLVPQFPGRPKLWDVGWSSNKVQNLLVVDGHLVSVEPLRTGFRWIKLLSTLGNHYGIMALKISLSICWITIFPAQSFQLISPCSDKFNLSCCRLGAYPINYIQISGIQTQRVPYNEKKCEIAWQCAAQESEILSFWKVFCKIWGKFTVPMECFSVLSLLKAHQQPQQPSRKRKEMRQITPWQAPCLATSREISWRSLRKKNCGLQILAIHLPAIYLGSDYCGDTPGLMNALLLCFMERYDKYIRWLTFIYINNV